MKPLEPAAGHAEYESRPARGAWIETRIGPRITGRRCRAPRGARGLKLVICAKSPLVLEVAPRAGRVD